ncbi:MAG: hypothetical protein K1Y01_10970 [Vicinamibacteria bacterium]|nr:hypothetical protein [Vicinamibacteria bacterium]
MKGARVATVFKVVDMILRAAILAVAASWLYAAIVFSHLPEGWTVWMVLSAGAAFAICLGAVARLVCRDVSTAVMGGVVGTLLGANDACITDTMLSWWQRTECGLFLPYSLVFLASIIGGWSVSHFVSGRIFRERGVA